MTGASNDGREDGAWGVIAGETGLAHARAVINDQCGNLVVTHVGLVRGEALI